VSDLTTFRDHCARMSTAEHKPECRLPRPGYWQDIHPHPECPGCNPTADRALFARLAAEVDAYLDTADEPMLEMPS
jgi:hypothetical protein